MQRSPAAFARRLIWKFRRSGGEGHSTKFFASFATEVQTLLLRQAEVADEEIPAIASFTDNANWMLLTSHRLLWSEEGNRKQADLAEIEWVRAGRDGGRAKFPDNPRFKDMPPPRLAVRTKSGEVSVPCEPGRPFFGLWNALLLVARASRPLLKSDVE